MKAALIIRKTDLSISIIQREPGSPRQDTQHQVQDKERANNDERNKVHPVPHGTQGIIGLKHTTHIITQEK